METKADVLERILASRQAFLEAVAQLTEADCTGLLVEGAWTAKDLLAHLASWEETVLTPLRAYLASGRFTPEEIPDHLAWNDQKAMAWKLKSLDQIRRDYDEVRQELLSVLEQASPQDWDTIWPAPWGGEETLVQLVSGLAWHEEEHLRSLRNAMQRKTTG